MTDEEWADLARELLDHYADDMPEANLQRWAREAERSAVTAGER